MGAPDEIARIMPGFPRWEWWRGVNGQLYARRLKTSPPPVVRADDVDGLREQVQAAEEKRR